MVVTLNILFFLAGGILLLLCLLLILRIGFVRLESSIGRARDGFPPGKEIPHWSLADLSGNIRGTPSMKHWQLLIFVNYALGAFPELISLIEHLALADEELEVIILSAASKDFCEGMVSGLELQVPVVPVDMDFYHRFRVQVMPFAFIVNPSGMVRWVGVANARALKHAWQLLQSTEVNAFTEVLR